MKTGDRRQNTAYRGPQDREGYIKKRGVTMAEVDAYYNGLLKELKDLEKLLKEDDDETGQENNEKG